MQEILAINNKKKANKNIENLIGKNPLFLCIIANTETGKIPGISAAGANPELTDYTPAADMEYLYFKKCKSIEKVPISPDGIPTPALITKAALDLSSISMIPVIGGLNIYPKTPYIEFGGQSGGDISNAKAVKNVEEVFKLSQKFGEELRKFIDYVILGESVAGGTTTALGVLTALGFDVKNKISSSLAVNPTNLKSQIVEKGLKACNANPGDFKESPLSAIENLGDPMQPVLSGIAIGAAKHIPVLLAGGTQMAAILGIINSLNSRVINNIMIGTTKWIINDKSSDIVGIINQICPNIPILAANFNFNNMKYKGLKTYENEMVKEGVGAGGVTIAALLKKHGEISLKKITQRIELDYSKII
ncbi:MAG: nicotinate mononucleotide-dependent phosphoribosyltransferase CobT [Candidatus Odinarchaeota archaeon]